MENLYLILAGGIVTLVIIMILRPKKNGPESSQDARKMNGEKKFHIESVRNFYNEQTGNFLKVYGEIIQAFRTKNPEILLDYEAKSMELKAGQIVLDAGCGVCAPAIYFAKNFGVTVEALTISEVQAELSKEKVKDSGTQESVNIRTGDYHEMQKIYSGDHFDVVCFLESFGHSPDPASAIQGAFQVLKPGGMMYIKDLFLREAAIPAHQIPMREEADRINAAYRYRIKDLYETIRFIRTCGFILANVRTIDLPLPEFENLTISNEFQELTGIGKIDNWKDYIFPVDFFEIRCIKPVYDIAFGNSRYFLQNLYYLQVLGKSEAELQQGMDDSEENQTEGNRKNGG